nr:uncharacterized protein LOC109168966 [Ipomoea batatas]
MDDLSAKESRQLLTLARNVIAEPWPLPESKASSEEFDEKALQASLQILKNSSQPMWLVLLPCLYHHLFCISKSAPVCVSESLPVSVPYVPSLFVSESVPDLSISQFSEFHIRDVAQYVDQQGEPVSGSALSIPVLVVVPSVSVCGISFAGTEPVSESIARSSREKNPIISTSKRKLDDSDDVMFVSETRAKKKSKPSISVRMTRSHTGSVLPKSEPPKSAPKSAPASSIKKTKSNTFQPVLLHSILAKDWNTNWGRSLLFERTVIEDDLIANCNIISLLRDQNMLYNVQSIGP